jgi:site-specific recombinase XerD
LDDLPDEQKNVFAEAIMAGESGALPIDDYFETIQREDDKLVALRYSDSTRRKYSNFCESLGLFLLLNKLDFSPQLARCWADHCGRKLIMYSQLADRYSVPQHAEKGRQSALTSVQGNMMFLPKQPKLTSGQKNMARLPEWSRELLERYIFDEQRRGQEQSSLETERYACLKFLRFLEQHHVTSCENITSEVLREFNLTDYHVTPEGKKGYNSRIGRFLEFLGEQALVPKTLRFALPCKIAKKVVTVKTLNESEVSSLYTKKDEAESPLALRDAAMVMIALQMGLRAGDIANLKYSDISWRNRTVSFSQGKTKKSLLLPMPVMVGNCIYRYMTKGRPRSESDLVFLSNKAPYSKLKSSACADAINRILYTDTKSEHRYGSRILRKTFASRMLKSGNSADTIANLLGHDGIHTVMTYLSTDDEKMRMCAIPAEKVTRV